MNPALHKNCKLTIAKKDAGNLAKLKFNLGIGKKGRAG